MLRPTFGIGRFRAGYDVAQVDAFVERVQAAVGRRPGHDSMTVDELRSARFDTTRIRPGYDVNQVDLYLEEAAAWLAARQGTPRFPPAAPTGVQDTRPGVQDTWSGADPAPRFSLVRFREGYDVAEVDAFLERVAATIAGRPGIAPITAEDVRHQAFSPVRMREGYDMEEVDAYLDEVQRRLG